MHRSSLNTEAYTALLFFLPLSTRVYLWSMNRHLCFFVVVVFCYSANSDFQPVPSSGVVTTVGVIF